MTNHPISAQKLTVGYDRFVLLDKADFDVQQGDIFVIMGASGSGKSSLLHVLIGLNEPLHGRVMINGVDLTHANDKKKQEIMQWCGVLYQSGALFSSMTLGENVALPLQRHTDFSPAMIADVVALKLALVGLSGFEDFYPSQISGGMAKRAGLARALALDPKIVYFDEPSSGLDPITSKALDDLMRDLNQSLGMTFVLVTHELPSILGIGTNGIFLDSASQSILARGNPQEMLKHSDNPIVRNFLTRGDIDAKRTK